MSREMKASGIPWIGEIPAEWLLPEISHYTSSRSGGTPNRQKSEYWKNGTIPWMASGEVNKIHVYETNEKITELATKESSAKILPKNSVMVALNGQGKTKGMSAILHINAACNQSLCAFSCDEKNLHYRYLFYCLKSMYKYLRSQSGDDVRDGLAASFVKKQRIPLPSLDEQRRIAEFLDAACAAADAYIARTQAVVERLLAYKKSVITEAVTQGLAPDAPRRASGIDWIGDIPAHWEVTRVKNIFSSGKGLPITKADLVNSGLPVISYGQIHSPKNTGVDISEELLRYVKLSYREEYPQCEVFQYDFVFADTSEDHEGCGNCVYKRDASPLFAGYHAIILHAKEKRDNRFLAYLFKTDAWRKQLREAVYGVKVLSVTKRMLMNCSVIIPPIEEQRAIADFLDAKCAAVDAVIARKREIISKISEYKRSLIYEAVTGKREV